MKYLFTIILIVFLLAHSANAQTLSFYDFNIGQPLSQAVFDFDKGYDFSLASGDLGGDGKAEIILAAGKGQEPWIRILRADGSLITQLLAYDKSFTGGVSLCVQDLNNDGKAEIVVGAGEGGGPHVRILKIGRASCRERV